MRHSRKKTVHHSTAPLWLIFVLLMALALLLANCDRVKAAAEQFGGELAAPAALVPQEEAQDLLPQEGQPQPGEVELQMQNPELPNGCEVTSLAMVLTAWGYPADKVTLADNCLPCEDFWFDEAGNRMGPDPDQAYAGDPASATGGWYCLEGAIVTAANAWISSNGGGAQAQALTGLSREELEEFAQAAVPLVVWITRDYQPVEYADYFSWQLPDGSTCTPYNDLHCVVLAGEEDGSYRIADPLNGWQLVDPETFWQSFSGMGCRAVAIQPE